MALGSDRYAVLTAFVSLPPAAAELALRQKTHKPGPRQASGASHPPQRPGGMERNWRKEKGEKKLKGSPPPNQARD